VTPEATRSVIQKEVPGIAEIMRISGFKKTPTAVLSRAVAGSRGRCLIINLPGNPRAVQEYLDLLMPIIPHAIDTIQGKIGDHK
jgi:molybdopterin biosynthesis enzyme MoaB